MVGTLVALNVWNSTYACRKSGEQNELIKINGRSIGTHLEATRKIFIMHCALPHIIYACRRESHFINNDQNGQTMDDVLQYIQTCIINSKN